MENPKQILRDYLMDIEVKGADPHHPFRSKEFVWMKGACNIVGDISMQCHKKIRPIPDVVEI